MPKPAATDKMPCAATDSGAANLLAKLYGEELRYAQGVGWHRWTGTRWVQDEAVGVQYVQRLIVAMYKMAADMTDTDTRRALAEFATSCESANRIRAIEFLARHHSRLNVRVDAFDADLWLFNTATGTIDARTGQLRAHKPADLITKLSPVAFDPAAPAPTFLRFFNEILADDPDLIEYLRRVLGMALTGDVREQYLWIFVGLGANGKSTLMDVLAYIMGDYFALAAESLLVTKGRDEHPTELADLQGKRIVLASETDRSARLKIQLVKRLTGDSVIKGRRMRQDFYEFPRTHKLFIMSNNRPRVTENSEAVWRRIRLVPFTVIIPEGRRDKQLLEKLKAEAPGILTYLLAGCLAWQKTGLGDPEAVKVATSGYRADSDPLKDFLEDRCALSPDAWTSTADMYAAYCSHAEAAHEKPIDKRDFGEALSQCPGVRPDRRHAGRGWRGIDLNSALLAEGSVTRDAP